MKKKSIADVSISFPVLCIGIASNARDYRMAHFLNRDLDLGMKRATNKMSTQLKGQELILPYYIAENQVNTCFLFENKNKSGILFPQYKNFNFWLVIRSRNKLLPEDIYSDPLSRIEIVIASFRLEKEAEINIISELLPE